MLEGVIGVMGCVGVGWYDNSGVMVLGIIFTFLY